MKKLSHIIITGPSGAGKSTYARQLAADRNLPLVALDDYDEWKTFHADKQNKTKVNYDNIANLLTEKALNEPGNKILEGQQFLRALPEIPKNHEFIIVDPGREETIKRRVQRSIQKWEKENNRPANEYIINEKRKIAEQLYDYSMKDLKKFNKNLDDAAVESAFNNAKETGKRLHEDMNNINNKTGEYQVNSILSHYFEKQASYNSAEYDDSALHDQLFETITENVEKRNNKYIFPEHNDVLKHLSIGSKAKFGTLAGLGGAAVGSFTSGPLALAITALLTKNKKFRTGAYLTGTAIPGIIASRTFIKAYPKLNERTSKLKNYAQDQNNYNKALEEAKYYYDL